MKYMKTIVYSSPFIPAEWIAAYGLRPLWLSPKAAPGGSAILISRGICPYAGAIINVALADIEADALALTTACDQMRYAAATIERRGNCPVFLFNMPSTWQTAGVRKLYHDELLRLGRFLERLGGNPPSDAVLTKVMTVYDRARVELLAVRENLSAGDFAEALAAVRGLITEQDNQNNIARTAASAEKRGNSPLDGIPLAVVGGPLMQSDYTLLDLIEQAGGRVALDATESGERTLPGRFRPTRIGSDPLRELCAGYFDDVADAFRRPNSGLYEWLGRELAARKIRGIIFHRYVWCDLWHAELDRLKSWSPAPVLEIDGGADDSGSSNRALGRIEAFLEMLKACP